MNHKPAAAHAIEKVTMFVTRPSDHSLDLLLLDHPFAGIQIPAGTVNENESPEQAALREAWEETGLKSLTIAQYLGQTEEILSAEQSIIAHDTTVYARPDLGSFDWSSLPRGAQVEVNRVGGTFTQVTYTEFDQVPNSQYVTMCITGWVPNQVLTQTRKRHFYHLEFSGESQEHWTIRADNHLFSLFWTDSSQLPPLIPPQDQWLQFFTIR